MMQGDVFHWKPMSWLFYVVISCFIMLYPHISTVSSLVCDLFKRWELSKADAMPAAETSCPEAADPAPDAKPDDAAWAATVSSSGLEGVALAECLKFRGWGVAGHFVVLNACFSMLYLLFTVGGWLSRRAKFSIVPFLSGLHIMNLPHVPLPLGPKAFDLDISISYLNGSAD